MISVIIPAFNAWWFIKRTIDSVLAQTYSDYEIIVVDDGSKDSTGDVVKSYGPRVRYIYQENAGDGPARNTGIYAAKGDWIAFLDHDDEWLPEKLRLQMELLSRNRDLRWCAANYYKACGGRQTAAGNSTVLSKALGGKDYFEGFFEAVSKRGCSLITTTMLVHREVFERAGVFDSCWMLYADVDMWWRIAYQFPKIGYLSQPLAIVHLDIQHIVSTRLRLGSKRGEDTCKLITKHLEMSKEHSKLEEFRPLAKKILRNSLFAAFYRGFKQESRAIVKKFGEFFPWHWRFMTYLLTIFPKVTSAVAQAVAYLAYKLRLERQVTRRWIYPKEATEADLSD